MPKSFEYIYMSKLKKKLHRKKVIDSRIVFIKSIV